MCIFSLAFLISCMLPIATTYATSENKACPYSEHLTWPALQTSKHIRLELSRAEVNEQEWNTVCSLIQQLSDTEFTKLQRTDNHLILDVERGDAMSDEDWLSLLHALVDYCKEIPSQTNIKNEAIVITRLK
jgi:hypothetical protein